MGGRGRHREACQGPHQFMDQSSRRSERIAQQIRRSLAKEAVTGGHHVTGAAVRLAARMAVRGTQSVGQGSRHFAREAVHGAFRAVGEVGGETKGFVKDAVIGVVEGTGQVVKVTTPAVKEVVVGAVRGSEGVSAEAGQVGRDAVEGAIVGAASVGIDSGEAASAAAEGAVEAVMEVGGDLENVARASVGGVVSGVAATEGDVAEATRDAAHTLITHAAAAERSVAEIATAAEGAVAAALQEAEGASVEVDDVVAAAATGAVEAAYKVSRLHGDSVRLSVVERLLEPRLAVAPQLERRLSKLGERLSSELPRGRAAWRGAAIIGAARLLLRVGGIDLAGSLAYFTILSLLPLVALVIMVAALFGDPESISDELTEILVYYFPSSADLISEAVEGLLRGSLAVGLIAAASIVIGANGLFMATNRAMHRIFELELPKILQTTAKEILIATLVVILFMLSVGLTALFQLAVGFSEGLFESQEDISTVVVVLLGVISTILPAGLTAAIFTVVYYHLPNAKVEWRNAAFGAIVAVVLFEIGKHLFFWFTNMATQRSDIYGPVASAVTLITWAYVAGLTFLYGVAVAKTAGELRPGASPQDD